MPVILFMFELTLFGEETLEDDNFLERFIQDSYSLLIQILLAT